MKKIFAITMCVMMVMCFMPSMAFADGETTGKVAKIGDIEYDTLQGAVNEAEDGQTITLLSNVENGTGVATFASNAKNLTIDFGGHTYTVASGPVGSKTYETQGFHLEKHATKNVYVTLKNGTITSSGESGVKMLVQNYCDLTLENMTLDGSKLQGSDRYVLSNNCGNVTIKDTTITAKEGDFAFDSCKFSSYDIPTVTVEADSVIYGNIENTGGNICIKGGAFTDLANAVKYAENGATIKLLDDVHLTKQLVIDKEITLDLNDKNITSSKSVFDVNGTLTIKGSGSVYGGDEKGNYYCINAKNGSTVNLYDGEYSVGVDASDEGNNTIYTTGGNINIYGGKFSTAAAWNNFYYVLNQNNSAHGTITVYGGEFEKYNPADGDDSLKGDFVAPGYISYKSGENWIVTALYVPSTPETTNPITNHDETTESEGQTETTPTTTADLSKDTASKTETVTNEAGQTIEKTIQTTTVAPETAGKIVEKAVENKSEEIVLDATTAATAEAGTQTQVVIPATTVQQIVEKTGAAVTVKTDVAEITLDTKATEAIAQKIEESGTSAANQTVAIVLEKAKESDTEVHFELSIETSNGKVSDFEGGIVTVTVPVSKEMAAKELVCVYIAEDGTVAKVPGKLNADGTYTFTTDHFSTYAIMTAEAADEALDAQEEKLAEMVKAMKLTVRSAKTSKGGIKVTATASAETMKALKDAGYTVKYKFYRSTKKASKYVAKLQKATNTYTNTGGKKGVRYYYKATVKVYNEDGKLIASTALKNCKYACRVK